MSYRDDRDADQARIAALEAELATSKQRVEELEGKRSQALVLASGGALAPNAKKTGAVRWAGAPLRLALERRFDKPYPTEKFEDLIDTIRRLASDRGRTELLRTSFTWSAATPEKGVGPFTSITVSVRDGATTVTATDRLGQLAGALYGGIGGGVGFGAIMGPIAASIAVPVLTPVFVLGWLGGVYAGTRALFKRSAKKRAESLQQLFDAVVTEIETTLRAT